MANGFFAKSRRTTDRLKQLTTRASAAMLWERIWPLLAPVVGLAGLFAAVSWTGIWTEVPRWGRIAGVSLFGLAVLAALSRFIWLRLPGRSELLGRLDRDSGLAHRPATTIGDAIANPHADPSTSVLWQLHLQRAQSAVSQLRVAMPSPRLADKDRFALRGAALLAFVAAAFMAGPEKHARMLAAFDWTTPGVISQGFRLDAWIDPPGYTGRPPVLLNVREETAAANAPKDRSRRVEAPVGSTVIVRASEGSSVTVEAEGSLVVPKVEEAPNAQQAGAPAGAKPATTVNEQENRWSLKGDGRLVIRRMGTVVGAFDIIAIPDKPPTIALKDEPKPNVRGSLTLAYKIDDDYGIIGAEAEFSKPVIRGKPVTGRSLVEPPRMPLALPSAPGGLGEGETTADLSEHAWAGARVSMTLTARDEGGNAGTSEPVEMVLPQRTFVKPLARALVEQRRNLVLSPDDKNRVTAGIEALMIAPERFKTTPNIYLGLYTISSRLKKARTDDALLGVADLMWEMALRLEEGDLSEAERDLRQAQQQLRDALQRGASEEEIKKLMENLRAAMDKFLRELAEQMRRDQNNNDNQQADNNNQQDDRTITSQDLQSMLDKMEEMARNGETADAQRMLDQLQNMLENLQSAQRRNAQQDQAAREMNRQLNELDKLMREQQELRDQTFNEQQGEQNQQQGQRQQQRSQRQQQGRQQQQQQGQRQPRGQQQQQDGQQGQQQEPGDDQMAENEDGDQDGQQSLQQQQENLRQRLEELQRRMKQLGMKAEEGFDEAGEAMKEAEQGLQQGGRQGQGKAVDAQGKALEALRKGAQSLAQQMQQQQGQGQQAGQGQGQGPGDPNGQQRQGQNNGRPDPLGRESHDRGDNSRSLYDPQGLPAAQRAQKVLEELRKRLSDPTRPREELDYIERLLRRY